MYKLAIIDDEYSTRKGLRDIVDWASLGIEIIGEAEDGREGISLIERTTPDIIICDVRMPRLDGIALVSQIRPAFPDLQVIFLSGHSEKAYLRSAIRFGAVDYLDKPVSRDELLAVIETAKKRRGEAKTAHHPERFHQYGIDLLLGHQAGRTLPAGFPVALEMPYITLQCTFAIETSTDSDIQLFIQQHLTAYEAAFRQTFGERCMLYPFGSQLVAHANLPSPLTDALPQALSAALGAQLASMAIGISTVHRDPESFQLAFRQATGANRCFYHGFGRCYLHSETDTCPAYESHAQTIDKITQAASTHEFSQAAATLSGFLEYLRRYGNEDIPAIRKELTRLAVLLAGQYRPDDQGYQFSTLERLQRSCPTLDAIADFLQDLLGNIISSLDNLSARGRVIYDVERYIQRHYQEELSIPAIAQTVYLTPTYLCYLFKKSTGKTLNSYITEVKMEKAKELLKNPSLKLSDIATMLGYGSQNYFTRIFTKVYGVNPTKYRNSML